MLLGPHDHRPVAVPMQRDLSIQVHPEAFVIGDMAHFDQDGKPLPGLSPVAMQQGRAVARSIVRTVRGEPREPFPLFRQGNARDDRPLARRGRRGARAPSAASSPGPLARAIVHIFYLIGFRERVFIALQWLWSCVTQNHAAPRSSTGLQHPLPSLQQRLQGVRSDSRALSS